VKLRDFLLDAKKAAGALAVGEAAAVEAGLIGNETAGLITAGIGVVSAVVVYLLHNEKPRA
jgi:hypothetical protein